MVLNVVWSLNADGRHQTAVLQNIRLLVKLKMCIMQKPLSTSLQCKNCESDFKVMR